jgi:4'-phosphopantetheinyl transferase
MQPLTTWVAAPEKIDLPPSSLHIWRIDLHQHHPEKTAQSRMLLNEEEKVRADRLLVESARSNFINARAALRIILSEYLHSAPRDLVFTYGPQGKPTLANPKLSFNLTHSNDIALLAIIREGEVGIDIEHIDPARATEDIAARFFSPAEQKAFSSYSGEERLAAFFRCWSRKESVIKALGEGLLCPLHSFDVSLDEHDAHLVTFRRDSLPFDTWRMLSINAHPAYAAAATTTCAFEHVRGFLFNPKTGID